MRLENLKIDHNSFYDQGAPRHNLLDGSVNRVVAVLAQWRERTKQRSELAHLDRLARRDIGITEADVWRELRKPPWRR